ncbi:MAG: tRNA pseudouridine(38-40) synthase TruA [Bacteroidaceae bacterium]|nr:tRNA pseudouridine(38-40) synthase TruA [Bacteroidaceae bacterium]MBR2459414.1 tRNA pseudouridine(38-40) synthase TruA [Bacteroidaceae bacterium]MBR2459566.1 tRNA pseudouridine(38-40) synthase TruA [Bacteroidaceae bacterium]
MRYFITFSYDGTAYHGWQIQPHSVTVQEELQKALSTLMRKPMEVVGAGRTDTGVHARKMIAHFDHDEVLDCSQLVYKLNKLLPRDIAVQHVEPVADDMHARFSAKSRTYHYYVHLDKNPFLRSYSWQVYGNPDFELMNRAARVLMEYKDFTSFSKVNTDTKTNDCTITEARWDRVGEDQWRFTVTANRFLRNMVRAIVGTLMEVGRGRMTIEQLRSVIEAKDRCRAGDSVPGNALFLVEVLY